MKSLLAKIATFCKTANHDPRALFQRWYHTSDVPKGLYRAEGHEDMHRAMEQAFLAGWEAGWSFGHEEGYMAGAEEGKAITKLPDHSDT